MAALSSPSLRQLGPNTSASSTGIAPEWISSSCRRGIRSSASASSSTKVRLRSLELCEMRCTRSRPNSLHTSVSLCSKDRMPRPTRVTALQGVITFTRHTSARSAHSASRTFELTRLSEGSSDTVTLASDEPIRSMDRPRRLKRSNTSARKPTCCHMPMVSMETSTMPRRELIAFTPARVAARWSMTVPAMCGRSVSRIQIGTRASRQGWMQRGCSTLAPVLAISCASS